MTPTFRVVRQGEQADTGGPGSGPKHGDPVWVSTEGCNVLLHPPKSLNLIQQAVVPFSCLVTCTQESCGQRATNSGTLYIKNESSVGNWANSVEIMR